MKWFILVLLIGSSAGAESPSNVLQKWVHAVDVSDDGRASVLARENCRFGTFDKTYLLEMCVKIGDTYTCNGTFEKYILYSFDSKAQCERSLAKARRSL
jgi:hypothetical protein